MEKEFIDLVNHVFTLQWASWALPVSILAAFVVKRFIPALLISVLAVVVHHAGPVILPALLGGESMSTIINDLNVMIPKLEPSSLLAAEVNRRPEPLESYPLDSVTMVGSLMKQNMPFALLRVDKLLYQVKLGDYLGQNYGKIVKISETDMSIREVVQDASGEWTERTSSIQLQEKAP
jgi:type IV pilus assembly protein PilP